jgi:hypothetical protein
VAGATRLARRRARRFRPVNLYEEVRVLRSAAERFVIFLVASAEGDVVLSRAQQDIEPDLGRVVFFGLGYRAGRERYAQIEASAKAVIEKLPTRYAEDGTSTSSSPSHRNGYSDIKLGD